jgi:hypothetical protein
VSQGILSHNRSRHKAGLTQTGTHLAGALCAASSPASMGRPHEEPSCAVGHRARPARRPAGEARLSPHRTVSKSSSRPRRCSLKWRNQPSVPKREHSLFRRYIRLSRLAGERGSEAWLLEWLMLASGGGTERCDIWTRLEKLGPSPPERASCTQRRVLRTPPWAPSPPVRAGCRAAHASGPLHAPPARTARLLTPALDAAAGSFAA